ncbi:transcription factor A, mitochondrial [Corythoichthys intestinalis]|uniref:transcription factor A, mitochondrial n=1 Tax=Corythoichthys intestinalis TaxID=161448 RepID=UPI0025A5594E|nr:transcription factor A, mitochondrial [Corythoichthys intestinalis]XP_061807920.1 transcription factor A, mitochondrial [Nerophis lumbriciformis]
MAPFGLVTASVSLLAKSFNVFTCTSTLARVVHTSFRNPVKCLSTQVSGPPKRPLNGYMRYVMQQKPSVVSQNPEIKLIEVVRKIAHEWRLMSPEQKRPFEDAYLREKEVFKVNLQKYQAQLTPQQIEQQAIEKRQRMAKRKAIRKKREANSMGKPKRPRSAFNIFMSEHFEEARGADTQTKLKTLLNDWSSLFSHQKQVYAQLAEDDKIRYKNEMKSWEDHMVEIGREDLIRDKTWKKKAAEAKKAKKVKKAAAKTPKVAKAKSKTTKKTKKSTVKVVKKTKKT